MQPTIFRNLEEIQEAVKCGYLTKYRGYKKGECNEHNLPTMFWKVNGRLTHQDNKNNEWNTIDYIRLLQKSVLWQDIREDFLPKTFSFMVFLRVQGCISTYLENIEVENQRWNIPELYKTKQQIKDLDPKNWIGEAFNWYRAEGGESKWAVIDRVWCSCLSLRSKDEVVWGDEEKVL